MRNFKKYYLIPAAPELVYLALTNPLTIQLWSGEEAVMGTEPNTEFSLWEGNIVGMNLEFETNKKIVQEWYFGDQEEKSIVTIKLLLLQSVEICRLVRTSQWQDTCPL